MSASIDHQSTTQQSNRREADAAGLKFQSFLRIAPDEEDRSNESARQVFADFHIAISIMHIQHDIYM